MMDIAQRFCTDGATKGFTLDVESGLWVCNQCGFPRKAYYLAHRSSTPPGVPIVYAKGFATDDSPDRSVRGSATRARH